jgi:hypothetical protein
MAGAGEPDEQVANNRGGERDGKQRDREICHVALEL